VFVFAVVQVLVEVESYVGFVLFMFVLFCYVCLFCVHVCLFWFMFVCFVFMFVCFFTLKELEQK